ncbi:MAG: lipoyl(octanoyl) transferase LipB [Alphaproteobacteria bacterium]
MVKNVLMPHRPPTNSPTAVTQWRATQGLSDYRQAEHSMKQRARAVREASAPELVWLVEHPPLYTAGTSANQADLVDAGRFPVHQTGRGGQFTYHGPGQRVAYVMLDVGRRFSDVRLFVCTLEDWLIETLALLGVEAARAAGRVGIWVDRPQRGPGAQDKIAAIGIRLTRWVSFHGISLNVNPNLDHYTGIVPCGITDYGVTSLADLGCDATMAQVDKALHNAFEKHFGPVVLAPENRDHLVEENLHEEIING